jgi:hypothetical protein
MEEKWRPCRSADGLLEASNQGRIRSVDRVLEIAGRTRAGHSQGNFRARQPGKILKGCKTLGGYLEVAQQIEGRRKKYRIHKLVAEEWVPGYFEGAHVDHIDGNKLNNHPSNLEWVTASENTRRQWESGLVDLRGDRHPSAKLTNLQAHAILLLYQHNFPPSQLAEWFGVSSALVYKIACGKKPAQGLNSRRPKRREPMTT